MLTTQSPAVLPRIHSLYSELPPNSRRAANLPFFAPRTVPASTSSSSPSCAPNNSNAGNAPGVPPLIPRRNSIPRRNAISYHPSQPASASASQTQQPLPPALLASPRPRPAVLVTSGYTPGPRQLVTSPPPLVVSLAPARVPRSQREYQAKMVANLLLNRGSRARPMRCARRGSFLRAGYQPSRLSMSVQAGDADADVEEEGLA
jgi:hypothetical protein